MALETGFVPDGRLNGVFRDPDYPEFLYNAGGWMISEDIRCWRCHDKWFATAPPLRRESKGAWDHDLVPCGCRKEADA